MAEPGRQDNKDAEESGQPVQLDKERQSQQKGGQQMPGREQQQGQQGAQQPPVK
jgi:hypothetical protein